MPFEGGPFHASAQGGNAREALAGAFSDAAPDSWGRRLLERAYGNGLSEFEYLTLSDDRACWRWRRHCRGRRLDYVDASIIKSKPLSGSNGKSIERRQDL